MFKAREYFREIVLGNGNSYAEGSKIEVPHYGLFTDIVYSESCGVYFAKMTMFNSISIFAIDTEKKTATEVFTDDEFDSLSTPDSMIKSKTGSKLVVIGERAISVFRTT